MKTKPMQDKVISALERALDHLNRRSLPHLDRIEKVMVVSKYAVKGRHSSASIITDKGEGQAVHDFWIP